MKSWKITQEKFFPKGDPSHFNKFYGYSERKVLLPNGQEATYFGVDVDPVGHIVAIDDDLTTYLVAQKRPNLMRPGETLIPVTLELPGGFLESDLTQEAAINKELREETGLSADDIVKIGEIDSYPGISNERDAIFIGRSLKRVGRGEFDPTEQDLEVVTEKFPSLYDGLMTGNRRVSAQTIASIAIAARYL